MYLVIQDLMINDVVDSHNHDLLFTILFIMASISFLFLFFFLSISLSSIFWLDGVQTSTAFTPWKHKHHRMLTASECCVCVISAVQLSFHNSHHLRALTYTTGSASSASCRPSTITRSLIISYQYYS